MAVKTKRKLKEISSQLTDTIPAHVEVEPLHVSDAGLAHRQVADRAFLIWLTQDRPHGQDLENWYEAETQLRGEVDERQAVKA